MPAPTYTPPTARQDKQRAIFDAQLSLCAIPTTIEHSATVDKPAHLALFHPAIFFSFPIGTPAEITIGRYPWDGGTLLTASGCYALAEAEARATEAADVYNRDGFFWNGRRFKTYNTVDPVDFAIVAPDGTPHPDAASVLDMPEDELRARALLAGTGDLVPAALTARALDTLDFLEAEAIQRDHRSSFDTSATRCALAYLLARVARVELSATERAILRRLSALMG